ncbi:MAG: DUF512 domain-containing protein, partial [Firmicutes bacterium]|nr:DUF512 domain-containing protein [Bacillota bacterium]
LWVTGVSASAVLRALAGRLARVAPGVEIEVEAVVNRFYGPTVTVAGLLTGGDLRDALAARGDLARFAAVLLPDVTLKADAPVFLDDMTLDELNRAVGRPLEVLPVDGRALVQASLGLALTSSGPAG